MIRINLLPPEERAVKSRRNVPVSWFAWPAAAAGLLVAAGAMSTAMQFSRISSLSREISQAERETAALAPQIARIDALAREKADMDLRISLVKGLESSRYVRTQLLDEASRQVPDHVWLTGVRETSPGVVQLDGVTFSNLMVADFMQRLESSPLYDGVDLTVSERGVIEDREVTKFTLTARLSAELGVTGAPAPKNNVHKREQ